ncbi:MAG: hypothetical protein NC082_05010 [Clostridiales bacterium]|nr:hypothetical protein [Clostridiales bacterium]
MTILPGKKYRYISILTMPVIATLLTGCFTGIESTPKITARDVKRQNAEITPEMTYAVGVTGDQVASWSNGKPFIVTDNRISLATSPVAVAEKLQPGDTIKYAGSRSIKSMTDIDDTMFSFTTPGNDTIHYRLQEPPDEVMKMETVEIPFTIEMSLINRASQLMAGNDYYITTPVWFNSDGDNITGRKLVKVHVDSVTAGNSTYPLTIHFTSDDGTHSRVYMSTGNGRRSTRNFETLFTLTNPRDKYKDITDEVWDCITRSTVKKEMTREQCRLSLGSPREVIRGHYLEQWRYDSGLTLIFDDGYLQNVR